jgi:hypothetical protein
VTTIARVPDIGSSTILRHLESWDHGHIGPTHRHGGGRPPARAGVLLRSAR